MIHWNPSPEIFSIGGFGPRWYGALFASGFLVGYFLLKKIFREENKPVEHLDTLLMYSIFGTIIGARLGHCLFYEPAYYLQNPIEILFVWKGGLASHGGTVGVLLAVYFFLKKYPQYSLIWLLDRYALVVGFEAAMIRLGNLMNSEIYGRPTQAPWAFVFERIDSIPRHPTQLYEALTYLLIFFILQIYWKYRKFKMGSGALFGWLMVLIFSSRFFIEFTKTAQADFERDWPIKMGQILSIPFIALGVFLVWRSFYSAPACADKKHANKNKRNS